LPWQTVSKVSPLRSRIDEKLRDSCFVAGHVCSLWIGAGYRPQAGVAGRIPGKVERELLIKTYNEIIFNLENAGDLR
jgi:hypothetical protein